MKNGDIFILLRNIADLESACLHCREWVSYAKVRGAYSMVGNDIPPFMTYSLSHITAGGEYLANDAAPFKEMEPEMNYSWEAGAEARFLNSLHWF